MNNFNEHIEVKNQSQYQFNKKFLIKLIVFIFFYRFYAMHIDKKNLLINYIDDCIATEEVQSIVEPIVIDELD